MSKLVYNLKVIKFICLNFIKLGKMYKSIMNKENASKLWKIIQEAGDYLQGQLPDHPNHPKGRNPYAHVAICVKSKFNSSYKDIDDEKFDDVVKFIEFLKDNPSPTKDEARLALSGNLCRCGAYTNYLNGVMKAAQRGISMK